MKKNYTIWIFLIATFLLIIYISYWSGNYFRFYHFTIKSNFQIVNPSLFWLSFSSISTLFGILIALFKNDILNFLFEPRLKVDLDKVDGNVSIQNNTIIIGYLLKVTNTGKSILEKVDFYYQSIRINNNPDLLQIRRPMAWSRKEEKRNMIEIFDFDHLDLIYGIIDLNELQSYFHFESRGILYNIPEKIFGKTEAIISANFLHQKEPELYKIIIETDIGLDKKIISELHSIIDFLVKELKDIQEKKNQAIEFLYTDYPYLDEIFNENDFNNRFKNSHIINLDNYISIESFVNNILVSIYLQRMVELYLKNELSDKTSLIKNFSQLFTIVISKNINS